MVKLQQSYTKPFISESLLWNQCITLLFLPHPPDDVHDSSAWYGGGLYQCLPYRQDGPPCHVTEAPLQQLHLLLYVHRLWQRGRAHVPHLTTNIPHANPSRQLLRVRGKQWRYVDKGEDIMAWNQCKYIVIWFPCLFIQCGAIIMWPIFSQNLTIDTP